MEAALKGSNHEPQVWRAIECSIQERDEFFGSEQNTHDSFWHNYDALYDEVTWSKLNKVRGVGGLLLLLLVVVVVLLLVLLLLLVVEWRAISNTRMCSS